MDARDTRRIEQQVEERVNRLWAYVRDYRNSLDSELHERMIRDLVETPLSLFEHRMREAQRATEEAKKTASRYRERNTQLRNRIKEMRQEREATLAPSANGLSKKHQGEQI